MAEIRWPLEPDAAALEALTAACARFAIDHVLSLPRQPASDVADAFALAASFREPPPETGQEIAAILARLAPAVAKSFNSAGPGYLAYIPGGGLYAAALADFIACAVNRYVGMEQAAPALARIEMSVIDWLAGLMGYPVGARGILTSGGSLSNFSAVTTARAAKLPEDFLAGTIYASSETHHSLLKAARLAGFPRGSVRVLPVDERLRLSPAALDEAVRADRSRGLHPFLVVANVGTTNTGAVDPLRDVLEVARRHDLWVHGDAAYGGFFRLAPGGEALMPGIEECDSITLDPHKGFFLPYGTGCLLVRDGEALRRAHQETAEYLQDVQLREGAANFADFSPELSRDFRGLRIWLPVQLHGLSAFRDQLAEKLALTRFAYDELRSDSLFEMLDEPQLSIVAFRLRGPAAEADVKGAELMRRVNAGGRVFLSSTRIGGRHALRICVLSFRTHRDRVQEAVAALRAEARAL